MDSSLLDYWYRSDWRKASYIARRQGYIVNISAFGAIYQVYLLYTKHYGHAIDVRNKKIDKFVFQQLELCDRDIRAINDAFVELGLLTKKYTIPAKIYVQNIKFGKTKTKTSSKQKSSEAATIKDKSANGGKKLELSEDGVYYVINKRMDTTLYNAWIYLRKRKGLSCKESYDILVKRGFAIYAVKDSSYNILPPL